MSEPVPPDPSQLSKAKKSSSEGAADRVKKPVNKPDPVVSAKSKPAAKPREKEKTLEHTPADDHKAAAEKKARAQSDSKHGKGDPKSDSKSDSKSDAKPAGKPAASAHKESTPDSAPPAEDELADAEDADSENEDAADPADSRHAASTDHPAHARHRPGRAATDSATTPVPDEADDPAPDEADAPAAGADPTAVPSADGPIAAVAPVKSLPELPDLPPDEDERFHAMCAWLSAAALILVMVCPLYFAGPLLYFLRYRSRSHFVSFHAKQAFWWSLAATAAILMAGGAAAWLIGSWWGYAYAGLNLFLLVPLQVALIVWFAWIGLKALHGVKYQTPAFGPRAQHNPQSWF